MDNQTLMFRRAALIVVVAAGLAATTGCFSTKSYVDPGLADVQFNELDRLTDPGTLYLEFEFQRNGKSKPRITKRVQPKVEMTLRASGLFADIVDSPQGADTLDVTLNNVSDVGSAVGKGIGTGLTFGLAGSMVTDTYVFDATYTPAGGQPVEKEYRHAIHSTVGNKKGPEGLQPMTAEQAFDEVVEDLVLNLLRDLQADGYLVDAEGARSEPEQETP